MGLRADEFYSMTWGNFQRASLGYVKRQWAVSREVVAAIYSTASRKKVTGEDVFPFGITDRPEPPSEQDREEMRKRHEYIKKHGRQED